MRADPRSGHDLRGERVAGVQAGIEALRHETKSEVAKVEAGIEAHRQETKAGTAAPKAQLVKWAFGVMGATTALFTATVKLTQPGARHSPQGTGLPSDSPWRRSQGVSG